MNKQRLSLLLVGLMILTPLTPVFDFSAEPVSAQTNPPNGAGDWTIPANDTTWINGSNVLVQGNVKIYGTLIIEGGQLSLWGTSAGERDLIIYNGGSLLVRNNSRISAFSSNICYDFTVNSWTKTFEVTDSVVESYCSISLAARNWTITDSLFEGNSVTTGVEVNSAGNTSEDHSWNLHNVTFANSSSCSGGLYFTSHGGSTVLNSSRWQISNLTFRNAQHWVSSSWGFGIDYHDFFVSGVTCTTSQAGSTMVGFSGAASEINITRFEIRDSPFRAIYSERPLNLTHGLVENTTSSTQFYSSYFTSWTTSGYDQIVVWLKENSSLQNVSIRNNHNVSWSSSSNSNYGADFYCYAVYIGGGTNRLDLKDVIVEDNCVVSLSGAMYSNNYYSDYQYNASSSTSGRCSLWNSGWGEKNHYNTDADYYCRITKAVAIRVSGPSTFDNVLVQRNQGYSWSNTGSTSNHGRYHGLIVNHGIELTSNSASHRWNRVNVSDNAINGFNYWQTHSHSSMNLEQVMFHGGTNAVLNITDSTIPQQSCNSFSPYQYTSNGGPFAHRTCLALRMDSGTLFATNTTYGSLRIDGGSLVRQWYLDVRVVDPDNQYTPNATVTLKELGIWTYSTQSTGPSGDLVRFWARQYSQTSASTYSYTPHNVTVTMTNYTNGTSLSMTTNQVITMWDPTPDAFPGDVTQDWDTDGDGYGDNISGNNPDHFPNDASQWNDTDLDGYGDNLGGTNPDYFPNDSSQWNDTDGDGYGDNLSGNNPDLFPNDSTQWNDTDGDGYGDNAAGNNPDSFPNDVSQWQDADGDGYGDNASGNNPDAFPSDSTQWADSDGDGYGDNAAGNNPDAFPNDVSQWQDSDGDGYGDNATGTDGDAFPNDATQWEDWDGDGYGDNASGNNPDDFPYDETQWYDGDDDGLGDNQSGNNSDPYLNDSDNDGYNNSVDPFPMNPTQWEDGDQDGLGDNQSGTNPDPYLNDTDNDGYNNTVDPFPRDATQWEDADGDGFGDNQSGYNPDPYLNDSDNDGYNNSVDEFPWIPSQWSDTDGDGWGDNASGVYGDDFTNDSTQWQDADGDGRGDNPNGNNSDVFPNDPTQWDDYDGDGHGDNPNGTLPDEFPFDATQWRDLDGDGYGDNYTWTVDSNGLRVQNGDAFVNDATQWSDVDGDGHGDNPNGTAPDEYPYDATQWRDVDGDSFPDNYTYDYDNATGLRDNQTGDAFPQDPTQWSDIDGDGYGDNASGNNADEFPYDPTQWVDADNDGLGDNPNGNNPDPTPGDSDNDGIADWQDAFPNNPTQWSDSDGDGYGDNWAAAAWVNVRNSSWPGQFMVNATQSDYFPLNIAAANDTDLDGFPDEWTLYDDGSNRGTLVLDECPTIAGAATSAGPGCPDTDGDRHADHLDAFPENPTQWADEDGDGYGDNASGTFPDMFPADSSQWFDRDGDGWGDNQSGNNSDAFPDEPTQWQDSDGDGRGDNPNGNHPDAFPDDSSQWLDSDGDGMGDNPNGTNPDPMPYDFDNDGYDDIIDACPTVYGSSSYDRWGCPDSDGDKVSDLNDSWPNDSQKSIDSDGDGIQDPQDAFPSDPTQWIDNDNDGLGDNLSGNNPDPYLDDSDNDGVMNQDDAFPLDPTQTIDADGDGLGDNLSGNNPDPYLGDTDNDGAPNIEDPWPLDPSQWQDSDGDGYGDNSSGTWGDLYPNDPTQCCDSDGDGWGDNPNGTNPDLYPNDPTQWVDKDGDGLGDNPNGMNPDPFPGDRDNDGTPDNSDPFPDDPTRDLDSDGDGIADQDESLVMKNIAESSESVVLGGVLLAGAGFGTIGYLVGRRGNRMPKSQMNESPWEEQSSTESMSPPKSPL